MRYIIYKQIAQMHIHSFCCHFWRFPVNTSHSLNQHALSCLATDSPGPLLNLKVSKGTRLKEHRGWSSVAFGHLSEAGLCNVWRAKGMINHLKKQKHLSCLFFLTF